MPLSYLDINILLRKKSSYCLRVHKKPNKWKCKALLSLRWIHQKQRKTAALEKTLQTFAENRGAASVVDYLQYIQYHNKQINVAFFGDVAEEAAWAKTAMTDIQSEYALTMNLSYFSHPEESSSVYLNGGYSQSVAASNADVIFYVLPTKADQTADIALAQSTENIFKVYDEIKSALPNALIVLVTPPPAQAKMNDWNSRTLDYRNYATIWPKQIRRIMCRCMICMRTHCRNWKTQERQYRPLWMKPNLV